MFKIKPIQIKLSQLMSLLFVTIIAIWSISCEESSTSNDKSEIEKKLMNSTWNGVYTCNANSKSFLKISFFANTITFKDNGIANIDYCRNYQYPWKYLKENNLDYLQFTTEKAVLKKFLIKKLNSDTLLIQDSLGEYILQKSSNVYNNVRIEYKNESGMSMGIFASDCSLKDTINIPEYNFEFNKPGPNPMISKGYISWYIGKKSQIKIVMDDKINSQVLIDQIFDQGMYDYQLDVSNKTSGVYRITCYVNPESIGVEKSISTYFFVAR